VIFVYAKRFERRSTTGGATEDSVRKSVFVYGMKIALRSATGGTTIPAKGSITL
jgi:hypothetical protein